MADLRIATGNIPTQADSAMTYVGQWREVQPGAAVSLVGHSLGGGLCQVVGSWLDLPFVPGHGYETVRCAGYAANLNSVAASDARALCSALI